MCVKQLLIFFVTYFASRGQCFENGYSKDACKNLVPIQEQGEPNVTQSNSRSPYKATTTSEKYRRNRELTIVIEGENIEGFQLQFRKYGGRRGSEPIRIGEFVKWPAGAKPLQCDDGKNTAVTHEDLKPKNNLEFKWKAPDEDEGKIKLFEAYVTSSGLYWANIDDVKLDSFDLPVSVKDCGENKSCTRYSPNKEDCDGFTCTYLLTIETNDNDVEFSLGAWSDVANSFSAVGFSETKDEKIDIVACIRNNNMVSVKHYLLEAKGKSLSEKTGNIQNVVIEEEDNNFWCEFTRPLKDVGASKDFDKDLFWIYTWGTLNETSNEPILDSDWHQSQHNVKQHFNEMHYSTDSAGILMTGFMHVSLLSLFSLIIPQI